MLDNSVSEELKNCHLTAQREQEGGRAMACPLSTLTPGAGQVLHGEQTVPS